MRWDGKEFDLVGKTIMRKKNFQTRNPKLSFESVSIGGYFLSANVL